MAETTQSDRTLRSRHSSADKKVTRSKVQNQTNTQSKYVAASVPSQGRFKSKLTDTLKLKLTAQPPKKAKKTVLKQTDQMPTVTINSTLTNVASLGSLNGFTSVNSQHIPKFHSVYIGNLPLDITKEQLEEHFKKTCRGGVRSIRIPKEKGSDKGRGHAYMDFKDRITFGIALRLHQTKLAGRRITVEFSPAMGKKKDAKVNKSIRKS